MSSETYPRYIRIGDAESEVIELPTEDDGTMLLSTIKSQFPKAIGLRYKSDSGAWRGLNVRNDVFSPPLDGWGNAEYSVTTGVAKRKTGQEVGPMVKKSFQVKSAETEVSKGYRTNKAVEKDLPVLHTVAGQQYESVIENSEEKSEEEAEHAVTEEEEAEPAVTKEEEAESAVAFKESVRKLLKNPSSQGIFRQDSPSKLFVGNIVKGITLEDLILYFIKFGDLTDAFMPRMRNKKKKKKIRGIAFITFESIDAARRCLAETHIIKGCCVNVSVPETKDKLETSFGHSSSGCI